MGLSDALGCGSRAIFWNATSGSLRPEENRGFSNTADGASASAVIYSLILTCRAFRVDPLASLQQVLTELPQRDEAAAINDLLPFNYSTTTAGK